MQALNNIPDMSKRNTVMVMQTVNVIFIFQFNNWFGNYLHHFFRKIFSGLPPRCPKSTPKIELLIGVLNTTKVSIQHDPVSGHNYILKLTNLIGTNNGCISNSSCVFKCFHFKPHFKTPHKVPVALISSMPCINGDGNRL